MGNSREAVIVAAVRTPVGRYGGALKDVRPDDLAALVVRAAVERSGVEPEAIEDVFFGAANQAGEDNRNVARMAALLAGLPVSVAGATITASRLLPIGAPSRYRAARCPHVLGAAIRSGSHGTMMRNGERRLLTDAPSSRRAGRSTPPGSCANCRRMT